MKKLAILVVLFGCASAQRAGTDQMGVLIPATNVDAVRDAVVSHVTAAGFSVLSAGDNAISAEMPAAEDQSGYYFVHQDYLIWSVATGVRISGRGSLVDKRPATLRKYDPRREQIAMRIDHDLNADVAAIKAAVSR